MDAQEGRVSSNRAPLAGNPRRRKDYSDEDDNVFASKRQRTAVACNSCKNRKSRCNGGRPTCSTCIDLGLECVYRAPSRAQTSQAREMHWMRNRLQSIEELLRNIGVQAHESQNDPSSPQDLPLSSDMPPSTVGEARTNEVSQHDSTTFGVDKLPGEDTVDGMGAITFADESTSGHFGLSSNSAFFSHIGRCLDSTTTISTQRNAHTQHLATNMSRPASPPVAPGPQVDKTPNPRILPPQEDILRMVEAFFSVTGMFFPFIHKRSVINMVEEMSITRFSCVPQSWLCLLNAIMAIGTSLSVGQDDTLKHQEEESSVYFQRALILSPWTLSNPTNLEALQALAVMTIYLQGVSKSAQTWRLHGLLVQAAFQTGVHINIKSPKISPLEQEIRTRIWYMCFVLDRVLSAAYGRPPLIHNSYMQINLPMNVNLDDINDDGELYPHSVQTPNEPSSCSLFLATIKLYLIQGNMIEKLYHQNMTPSVDLQPNRLFSLIMDFEEHLHDWMKTLNPAVELIPTSEVNKAHPHEWKWTRPQTVMTIRFLSVRVLLYRRVIETLLDDISTSGVGIRQPEYSLPIAQTLIHACTESAIAIIQTIRALGAKNEMLPAWWFTIYHMFNAALVLFGVVCLQTIGKVSLDPHTPSESVLFMQIALEDLVIVGRDTRIVRRCSKYLQKMIQISLSLTRNISSNQSPLRASPIQSSFPQSNNMPFLSDESIPSPWDADFGQFLMNDDSNFLDGWTELAEPLQCL
ncbi:hypothetical protein B0A52_07353 [Exophiala mesophila]|uniref:Zn(2)-C6 fungal-type domain-containing protein n=1 Tax=Exophiala mesophila TaxID=212818 RepID=A0A438MZ88_EXOME|nr:hypothetical protein B0A52_07353 [Exophiala mesophila]